MKGRCFDAPCPTSGGQTLGAVRHGFLAVPEPFDPCHARESGHPERSGAECPRGRRRRWIPAFAGMKALDRGASSPGSGEPESDIGAQMAPQRVGIARNAPAFRAVGAVSIRWGRRRRWIPAFAGMTALDRGASSPGSGEPGRTSARKWRCNAMESLETRPGSGRWALDVPRGWRRRWIPACAGMTGLDRGASSPGSGEPGSDIGAQKAPQRIGIARNAPALRAPGAGCRGGGAGFSLSRE